MLEGEQPFRHALRVVEAVDAEEKVFSACLLADLPAGLPHLLLRRQLLEAGRVDTDRVGLDAHLAALPVHRVPPDPGVQPLTRRAQEVLAETPRAEPPHLGAP